MNGRVTDVAKASEAVSRPGIDPRMFVDLAIVTARRIDSGGCHYDVTTIGGIDETVALSPPYGGKEYGLYLPVNVDHMVTLAVPDGKYNAGARVIGATWDTAEPPPQEVIENPDDVALVVKPGQTVRVIVSGGGNVVIDARDGGTVSIGGENLTTRALNVVDGSDFMRALNAAFLMPASTPNDALGNLIAQLESLPPTTGEHLGIGWPVGAEKVFVK